MLGDAEQANPVFTARRTLAVWAIAIYTKHDFKTIKTKVNLKIISKL